MEVPRSLGVISIRVESIIGFSVSCRMLLKGEPALSTRLGLAEEYNRASLLGLTGRVGTYLTVTTVHKVCYNDLAAKMPHKLKEMQVKEA